MNNYTIIHCHTDVGAINQSFDSLIKYKDLIKWAAKQKMSSLAITEHGAVTDWILKKQECDKNNIKYIHGAEFYLAYDLNIKERQNFHICLYAKNYEGVKEINKLSSLSFQGNARDGWQIGDHFYYLPRISLNELFHTSDNIICTSACLGSILWHKKDSEYSIQLLEWMSKNKNRCFLELQGHSDPEQIEYNQLLLQYSQTYNIPLIIGTDDHVISLDDLKLRSILLRSKKKEFDREENFDLSLKTYTQLVKYFKNQGSISLDVVLEALENTNKLAEMCENWLLDKTYKYPQLYKNPEEELRNRLNKSIIDNNITNQEELNRLEEEFQIFKEVGMLNFNLLVNDVTNFCKKENIAFQPRGSCNGSQLYYRLGITDINAMKFKLHFFRFCNPERVSLGDVDIDTSSIQRPLVKDFLYNYKKLKSCAIITYQTLALRGAIRKMAKGMGYGLDIENMIAKDIIEVIEKDEFENETRITTFNNKEKWMAEYPDLIENAYKVVGIIENVSSHACGMVTSDINIQEHIGVFENKNSPYVISQNSMKAIDSVNFVKMDLLAVNNVQIVNDTEKLAKIQLKNDTLDLEDENVWNSMKESGLGIFQFEKQGQVHLKRALDNFDIFLQTNPKITRYNLMLALNAVLRPACNSFRDEFLNGKKYDIGLPIINEFFNDTQSYIIFQENIMMFLQEFCEYTGAEADTCRRYIGKKMNTKELIPEIQTRFINNMQIKYNIPPSKSMKIIKKFLKIVEDATNYGFSTNHSCPYTLLGYKGAYLRYYYPLEFLTVQLNVNQGKMDKIANITEYINKYTNIKIKSICFKKSKSEYFYDKKTNTIYKGISSIKGIGDKVGDALYRIKEHKIFIKVLMDIKEKSILNETQLKTLIKLDFFKQYGNPFALLALVDKYYIEDKTKKKTYDNQISLFEIKEVQKELDNDLLMEERYIIEQYKDKMVTLKEKLLFEYQCYEYCETTLNIQKNLIFITNIEPMLSKKGKIWAYRIAYESLRGNPKLNIIIESEKYMSNMFYKYDIINIYGAIENKEFNNWKLTSWEIENNIDLEENL